jgi:hypothetical protein
LPPEHPEWLDWQHYYLEHPEAYPTNGNCPEKAINSELIQPDLSQLQQFSGIFHRHHSQDYTFSLTAPASLAHQTLTLVTLRPEVDQQLQICSTERSLTLWGRINLAGNWLLVHKLDQRLTATSSPD